MMMCCRGNGSDVGGSTGGGWKPAAMQRGRDLPSAPITLVFKRSRKPTAFRKRFLKVDAWEIKSVDVQG
ncbi:hypothetical protein F2P81_002325 [Scophthalmus maximus]|uniref:Uncharacterized protein n=1 Tax=Scophthalmus maximus TaxID=52904 RepID=A0A6A4TDY3_SCOMX|nr:hypothetical protein F2P81_002325 [Scophthalmus maximus]